jgi:predicted XRE-type DNA-binding protein
MSKKKNNGDTGVEHEGGSGNVFADLGLPDADERLARSKLGFHVYTVLTGRKLTQRELAALLGIKRPEVSHLMNGHFNLFTTDKLLDFLKRLDRKVTITISPHHPGEPYQEVGFGALGNRRTRPRAISGAGIRSIQGRPSRSKRTRNNAEVGLSQNSPVG